MHYYANGHVCAFAVEQAVMIPILPQCMIDDDLSDFGVLVEQLTGRKPELPPEIHNSAPVDADRAHQVTQDMCRGNYAPV